MEPISTGLVLGWLARYAGHAVGVGSQALDDVLLRRMTQLWDAVAVRFGADPSAKGALDRLHEQPDNPRRQGAVEDHLEDVLAGDPRFAAEVHRLLGDLETRAVAVSDVRVSNAGAVAFGGDVRIHAGSFGAGRDITTTAPGAGPAPSRRTGRESSHAS
jgi:hypothetical protein